MPGAIEVAGRWWRSAISDGLDWLWPYRCLYCGQPVTGEFKPERRLCWDCHKQLPWMQAVFCPRCLVPYSVSTDCDGCPSCRDAPPPWEVAHATFRYADPVREWIHDYKYHRRYDLRRPLAHLLIAKHPPWLIAGGWDAIIAMPTHPRRLLSRGFDHIHLMAEVSAGALGLELLTSALTRKRFVRPQVGLEGSQRSANVAGSFEVVPRSQKIVSGKRIILMDDVITTGATLREASGALLAAGSAKIGIWTLASALGSGDEKKKPRS